MTTRLKGVLVTFEQDIREDDAEILINAIRMLRRVLDVVPVPNSVDDYIAEMRVKTELRKKLWEVLDK